jgi:2-succinyl-6-hydroxy-2,4-cyclohexadiene-1-carboxylate synthase
MAAGGGLHAEVWGEGEPLLLLHGFTGASASWAPLRAAWRGRRLIAPDLPGHGASVAVDPGLYRMDRCVGALAVLLDRLGVERADVLGYSMGGRTALHFAAAYRERVRALVLESASPGIADPRERAERVAADEVLAERIERQGVAAFVDYWESLPLFASQRSLPAATRARLRAQRLANAAAGLAGSLRGMGTGAQQPLWERLAGLSLPVLLIAGELDEKYRDLAREMAASLPDALVHVVPGAGHAVHLERPAVFAGLVSRFLKSQSPAIEKEEGRPWVSPGSR